jgi:hypothetical protein
MGWTGWTRLVVLLTRVRRKLQASRSGGMGRAVAGRAGHSLLPPSYPV